MWLNLSDELICRFCVHSHKLYVKWINCVCVLLLSGLPLNVPQNVILIIDMSLKSFTVNNNINSDSVGFVSHVCVSASQH